MTRVRIPTSLLSSLVLVWLWADLTLGDDSVAITHQLPQRKSYQVPYAPKSYGHAPKPPLYGPHRKAYKYSPATFGPTPKPHYVPTPYSPSPKSRYPSTPKPPYHPTPTPAIYHPPVPTPTYAPPPKATHPSPTPYHPTPKPTYTPAYQPPTPAYGYHRRPKAYTPASPKAYLPTTTATPVYHKVKEAPYNPKPKPKPYHPPPKPAYHPPKYQDAPSHYAFGYAVKDGYSGDDFSHSETRDGLQTSGEYRVALPDGRVQIVTYTADENGYHADVKYEGEARPYQPPPAKKPYKPAGYKPKYVPPPPPVLKAYHPVAATSTLPPAPPPPPTLSPALPLNRFKTLPAVPDPAALSSTVVAVEKLPIIGPLPPVIAPLKRLRKETNDDVVYKPKEDPYKAKLAQG